MCVRASVCVCMRATVCVCVWVYATTKPVHRRQTTATGLGLVTNTGERADYLILFLFFSESKTFTWRQLSPVGESPGVVAVMTFRF